jgi:two-component sensor histidine kinase
MNALKHAFRSDNADGTDNGQVLCRRDELEGLGRRQRQAKTGLGTSIVKALAHQLGAQVETLAGPSGTTVSVTRATFSARTRAA